MQCKYNGGWLLIQILHGLVHVDSSVLGRVLGVSNKDHTSILRKKINAMQISTKGKRDLGMHILRIYHTKHFLDRVHIGERCPSQTKQVVVASQTTPFAAYALSISFFLLSPKKCYHQGARV